MNITRLLITICLLFVIFIEIASAQNNYPVPFYDAKGLWGFSDRNHKIIVPAKYWEVDDFCEGLAWVKIKEKCGFIDAKGKEVIPLKFKSAENFNNGFSTISIGEKNGVIDKTGNYTIPLQNNYISWFTGEVGRFSVDYIYGLIGKGGKIILPAEYPSLEMLTDNVFIVAKAKNKGDLMLGKMGLVNANGQIIIPPKYDLIYCIPGGFAKIKEGEFWGLIDSTGKELIPPIYQEIRNPKPGGFAGFKKDGLWGIIKFDGTITVQPKYNDLGEGNSYFNEAVDKNSKGFKVNLGGNYGIVDENGKELIPIKYSMLGYSSNGITPAYFKLDTTKTGLPVTGLTFIDSTGKELIPPAVQFNNVSQFSDGLIAVGSGSDWKTKWIYIDLTGKQIVPGEYEETSAFVNGLAIVKKTGKYGVINKLGKEVIPFQFKEINRSETYPGLFKVNVKGIKLYYDAKGVCFCN